MDTQTHDNTFTNPADGSEPTEPVETDEIVGVQSDPDYDATLPSETPNPETEQASQDDEPEELITEDATEEEVDEVLESIDDEEIVGVSNEVDDEPIVGVLNESADDEPMVASDEGETADESADDTEDVSDVTEDIADDAPEQAEEGSDEDSAAPSSDAEATEDKEATQNSEETPKPAAKAPAKKGSLLKVGAPVAVVTAAVLWFGLNSMFSSQVVDYRQASFTEEGQIAAQVNAITLSIEKQQEAYTKLISSAQKAEAETITNHDIDFASFNWSEWDDQLLTLTDDIATRRSLYQETVLSSFGLNAEKRIELEERAEKYGWDATEEDDVTAKADELYTAGVTSYMNGSPTELVASYTAFVAAADLEHPYAAELRDKLDAYMTDEQKTAAEEGSLAVLAALLEPAEEGVVQEEEEVIAEDSSPKHAAPPSAWRPTPKPAAPEVAEVAEPSQPERPLYIPPSWVKVPVTASLIEVDVTPPAEPEEDTVVPVDEQTPDTTDITPSRSRPEYHTNAREARNDLEWYQVQKGGDYTDEQTTHTSAPVEPIIIDGEKNCLCFNTN